MRRECTPVSACAPRRPSCPLTAVPIAYTASDMCLSNLNDEETIAEDAPELLHILSLPLCTETRTASLVRNEQVRESTWHLLLLQPTMLWCTDSQHCGRRASSPFMQRGMYTYSEMHVDPYRRHIQRHGFAHLWHVLFRRLRRDDAAIFGRRTLVCCMNTATRTWVASHGALQASPAPLVV